jgi:ABC-type branched-subunit amino acid transport system ATPase component
MPVPSQQALAAVILEEEARRQEAQRPVESPVVPDDLLLGARTAELSLREAVRTGGRPLLLALVAIAIVDEFDRVALPILAPDIQRSLGVSDAVIGAIGGAFGVLFVLGAVPMARLADRLRRTTIAGVSTIVTAAFVFLTGLAPNALSLFVTRMGAGLGQSHVLPVHGALLSDGYPIAARSRVFGVHSLASPIGRIIGTLLIAGVAVMTTGGDSWRTVFLVMAVPVALVGLYALRAPEPARGANEQLVMLGEALAAEEDAPPISLGYAWARLGRIRTFSTLLTGIGALGFALFSVPLFINLHLEQDFGLSASQRALVDAVTLLPSLLSIPYVSARNDRIFRESPPRSLLLMAGLIGSFGLLVAASAWMPNVWSYALVYALALMLSKAAFVLVSPVVAAVVPYRLRAQGFAMVGIYIFLMGAFFGAVITGWLSGIWGEQAAISAVVIPSTIIGGLLIARGANTIRGDISLTMEELAEEQEEQRRRAPGATPPRLQVRNLDFSYGTVQTLFDIDIEVAPGETLALLGTNGAGKSTLLRVISGFGVASRGVVRLDGRTITFVEAERRVRLGIVQVAGGRSTFDPLTVRETLRLGAYTLPPEEVDERIALVLDTFPALRERLDQRAGSLSGGQKQMLALAQAVLLEPRLLIIDELSLGLAPVVVQDLLEILHRLKAQGQTMIIVEQSVNVALAIADRAVFMEKGRVRFEGPAADLAERDDLLRAVFLGREGG